MSPDVGDKNVAPKDIPDTTAIFKIAEQEQFKGILTHPIITTFLRNKWMEIRKVYIVNILSYMLFFGFINAFIFLDQDKSNVLATTVMRWATFACLVSLTLKEVYQLGEAFWKSIQGKHLAKRSQMKRILIGLAQGLGDHAGDLDNWVELGLLISSFCLLFPPPGCDGDNEFKKHMNAVTILLSWLEGVFLVGNHPWFSIYKLMFLKVSRNFLKFLAWLINFVIAFGISFYFLLSGQGLVDKGEQINPLYNTTTDAILKTIVMSFAGEPEMGDIGFWTGPYGHFSKVIFVLFVFFILLVLTNLLNGLAIADIGQLYQESTVNSEIAILRQVHRYQNILIKISKNKVLNCVYQCLTCPASYVLSCCGFKSNAPGTFSIYERKYGSLQWNQIRVGKEDKVYENPHILNQAESILDNTENKDENKENFEKIENMLSNNLKILIKLRENEHKNQNRLVRIDTMIRGGVRLRSRKCFRKSTV